MASKLQGLDATKYKGMTDCFTYNMLSIYCGSPGTQCLACEDNASTKTVLLVGFPKGYKSGGSHDCGKKIIRVCQDAGGAFVCSGEVVEELGECNDLTLATTQ
jgi:hypothetical protein